jgi:hypothetical protein
VECHLFEEVATEPAIPSHDAEDPLIRLVVEEMEKFRFDVLSILSDPKREHDLDNFWLRKSKKPVLSVLLVEKNGKQKLYRGSNMEVSMPTGSLCAERNVIGSALADDLTLMREDIKIIAVYSVNMNTTATKKELLESTLVLEDSLVSPIPSLCPPCDFQDFGVTLMPVDTKSPAGHKRKIMRMTSEAEVLVNGISSSESTQNHHSTTVLTSSTLKRNRLSKAKSIPFASPSSHADLSKLDPDRAVVVQEMSRIVPTMTTIMVDDRFVCSF